MKNLLFLILIITTSNVTANGEVHYGFFTDHLTGEFCEPGVKCNENNGLVMICKNGWCAGSMEANSFNNPSKLGMKMFTAYENQYIKVRHGYGLASGYEFEGGNIAPLAVQSLTIVNGRGLISISLMDLNVLVGTFGLNF